MTPPSSSVKRSRLTDCFIKLPPQAVSLTCHDRANYRLTGATPTP
ncbi:hypothetical protein [Chamaesiphon sp. VAR_69_metabat_338]|nr:hypothetical protein [Chamaesiphon sp. VAR_69_metabat_338]